MNLLTLTLALTLGAEAPPRQETAPPARQDLTELSIEDLMNIEVTSIAKAVQRLLAAPAAVTVIRAEDLKRTGTTRIAEALRMVPGMNVGKIDANKWSISARGFQDLFANKLLVLVDGRSVYTPLFSGVHWNSLDLLMEDIQRIEVIRGPGATVWGANAVNGVINIITKSARDTQGGLATGGGGTEEQAFGSGRWGGKIGDDAHYRVYAKYLDHEEAHQGHDDWYMGTAGLRLDWRAGPQDTVTLHGHFFSGGYDSLIGEPILTPPYSRTFAAPSYTAGGSLQLGWEHKFEPGHQVSAKAFYDRVDQDYEALSEIRDTVDFELQHRFPLWGQTFTWGAGYRWTGDDLEGTPTLRLLPEERNVSLVNVFLQDEIPLVEDCLLLSLGSKFEYNSYTGFEYQPGARLSWKPHERHTVWASAARAVRTPSRAENDVLIRQTVLPPNPPAMPLPTLVVPTGSEDFRSEELLAYEAGYRLLPADRLSLDLAVFYNEYDDLRTSEPGSPTVLFSPVPHAVVPFTLDNKLQGRTYGAEVAASWQVLDSWRLYGAYSWLRMNLDPDDDSRDPAAEADEGNSPRNQIYLRSSWDLPENLQFDLMARYVDVLPGRDVDSYIELDARIGWSPLPALEVSLVGQNLLHDEHLESRDNTLNLQSSEVERGVYLSLSWTF